MANSSLPPSPEARLTDSAPSGDVPQLLKNIWWFEANWRKNPKGLFKIILVILVFAATSKLWDRLFEAVWPNPAALASGPNKALPVTRTQDSTGGTGLAEPVSKSAIKDSHILPSVGAVEVKPTPQVTLPIQQIQEREINPPASVGKKNTDSAVDAPAVAKARQSYIGVSEIQSEASASRQGQVAVSQAIAKVPPNPIAASEPVSTERQETYVNREGGVYDAIGGWLNGKDPRK